ncbi:MAG: class I SAM-dependent methyltransferase [Polyangia bacterium]
MSDDYDPELYELTHRGNAGDVEFYLDLCRGAGRVLELGCGSGRIALRIAAAGSRVVAVDRHPGMLELLEQRVRDSDDGCAERLRPLLCDFRRIELEERFDRVLIPYNALYCMLSGDDLLGALRAASDHLRPGGLLAFDVYCITEEMLGGKDDQIEELFHLATAISSRGVVDVFERPVFHPDPRRLDVAYVYRWQAPAGSRDGIDPAGRIEVSHEIPQRCFTAGELDEILAEAGLSAVSVGADFTDRAPDDETGQLAVVARRSR